MQVANRSEDEARVLLQELGFDTLQRGWPDFIAFKDDELIVVEVKPYASEALSTHQRIVMSLLQNAGIQCFKFTPQTGLQPFDDAHEASLEPQPRPPDAEKDDPVPPEVAAANRAATRAYNARVRRRKREIELELRASELFGD